MAIVGTLPNILLNGTVADASQVMADFNFIVNQVNSNAVPLGVPQPGAFLNVQAFSVSGTYTPTTGMREAIGVAVGGGGAGGGASGALGGNVSLGAPGGGGTWAQFLVTAVQVGASQAVTIGTGGPGAAGGNGFAGTATSLGTLISCPGGLGGSVLNNFAAPGAIGNGSLNGGGVPTGSANIIVFQLGIVQFLSLAYSGTFGEGGAGGSSAYGPGAPPVLINTNGNNASNYGAGGSGTVVNASGGTSTGGAGHSGVLVMFEYS